MTIKTSAVARPALVTKAEPVTMPLALTRPGNTAERVTTAARSTGIIMAAAPAITTADPLTRPTATIQDGPLLDGVTAHPGVLTRTRMRAATRTVVTTTTTRTAIAVDGCSCAATSWPTRLLPRPR